MSNTNQQVLVKVDGQEFVVEIQDISAEPVIAKVDGKTYEVVLEEQSAQPIVKPTKTAAPVKAAPVPAPAKAAPKPEVAAAEGSVTAPMPGDIVEVRVQPGQKVGVGDALCVLDAMKMKNVIHSPQDGVVASVEVSPGQAVDYGAVLVTFE